MPPIADPGRLLVRELAVRCSIGNRLALELGVPSGRITDILNDRRRVTAAVALRLGRCFGNKLACSSACGRIVVRRLDGRPSPAAQKPR
jgi:plasmid maintenance system antidote protein VapI